jgi:hypothetical protein
MSENLQHLQTLVERKSAVEWFKGLFSQAHLEVTDTGEKFTIRHHGDRAEVLSGFQAQKPNFVIPLESENISRLSAAFAENKVDDYIQYRIVKFMLKPCLKAALAMPILENKAILRIAKVDTHWQEALLDPQGNQDEQVTIIHVNKQWLVIPGYHGTPQRRLLLTPEQLLEFMRHMLEADAAGGITDWIRAARWYVKWREQIAVQLDNF